MGNSRGRRPRGMGHVYELDGRWRGQKTVNGRKLSTPWVRSEAAAERELRKLNPGTEPNASFARSFELFLAAKSHAITTELEYRRLVDVHLAHLKPRRIDSLDVEDFGMVIKALSKTAGKQTLNQLRVCITGAFDQAIGKGWVSINVGRMLRLPSTKPAINRAALNPIDANLVIDYLRSAKEPLKSSYIIGLRFGLRPNERRGLCWEHVHLSEEKPYIQIATEVIDERGIGTVFYPRVKTEQAYRRIYLDEESHKLLVLHREATEASSATWTDTYGNTPDLVWRQESGTPMTTTFERRDWRRIQRLSGIKPTAIITPYGMRHTAATMMLAPYDAALNTLGLDVYTVARILGHKDIQLVTTVYAKKMHATQAGAADALNRARSDRQVVL